MRNPIFTGSGTALITPFTGDGVDFPALGRLLDWQLDQGTDAFIVCGTTGEASTMSDAERLRTVEYCVERVNGRVPVIAGSGSNSTAHAVTLSRDAKSAGADALLLVTPYYNKASQTGLALHFRQIADAVDLPCVLYNVPSRTGVSIAPETCAELARHPNIRGIKEASGSMAAVRKFRNLCPEDFSIWSGNDGDTVPICALGGQGVISVLANVAPAQTHRLARLCLDNDFAAAGKLQLELDELCEVLFCEVNPIPVKTALHLMGYGTGELRLPLSPLSPAHQAALRRTLARYGLIPDTTG